MCGVPRRFIGDGVSLFRDVAHFASTSGFPLCYPVLGPGQSVRSRLLGFLSLHLGLRGLRPVFH